MSGSPTPPLPELILASTSPYRRALMDRLGLPFRWLPPRFDESSVRDQDADPRWVAEARAAGKAESLAGSHFGATIIASDQVAVLENRVLGKPGTKARAVDQLLELSGRPHTLITSLVVRQGNKRFGHLDISRLTMRALRREELKRYVERDSPLDCAGSYKLEAGGIVLFERIETEDSSAITGLPLIALTTILRELGYAIP